MKNEAAQRFDEYGNVRRKPLYLDVYKAPLINDQGVMIGTVGCGRDVTRERSIEREKREAETRFHDSEALFRRIAETSIDFIYQIDKQGTVTYASPAIHTIMGYKTAEVIGTSFRQYFSPDEATKARTFFERILAGDDIIMKELISSLLNLQSRYFSNKDDRSRFLEMRNRVVSMALVHEELYQSDNLAEINLAQYITKRSNGLMRSYAVEDKKIVSDFHLDDIHLDVARAIPCGLIINEVIANTLKHAFNGRKQGVIRLSLFRGERGDIHLGVADNGIGIPPSVDYRNPNTFGFHLITVLALQLNASFSVHRNGGTVFTMIIPG